MRLYHFTTRKFGLLALKRRRLKIARINALNDPFEFLGWNLRDKRTRAFMSEWKNKRNDELGVLCFSSNWSNPLLWGHYADKHEGLAIGFDVPDNDTYLPVNYCRKRPPPPSDRPLVRSDIDDILLTKFSAWRYEAEYRCFCVLADSIWEDGRYFEPFSEALNPAEVIIGGRSTISRAELTAALGDQDTRIISFKARPAFGSFDVVKNRNDALWT